MMAYACPKRREKKEREKKILKANIMILHVGALYLAKWRFIIIIFSMKVVTELILYITLIFQLTSLQAQLIRTSSFKKYINKIQTKENF